MTTQETNKLELTTRRPKKSKRIPLSEQRDQLTVAGKEAGYVYRWVNDIPDRVNKFKLAGYDVVTTPVTVGDPSVEQGLNTTSSVVEKAVGGRTKAILMRIPEEWYDEDQAVKQKAVDASEEAMRRDQQAKSDYGNVITTVKRG